MATQDPSKYFDAAAELVKMGSSLYSAWIHGNAEEKAVIIDRLAYATDSLRSTHDEILAAIAARTEAGQPLP